MITVTNVTLPEFIEGAQCSERDLQRLNRLGVFILEIRICPRAGREWLAVASQGDLTLREMSGLGWKRDEGSFAKWA